MASITIDPATLCVRLVCGAGETDVSFTVPNIYKAWKDWFVLSDNSKYLPAFDSAGGDPVGASNLDNVYFLQTQNGWKICPQTVEASVIVRLSGNLYPAVVSAPLFGYDYVAPAGRTHIETTVSTSARLVTTNVGVISPTPQQIRDAMQLAPSGTTQTNSVDEKLDSVKRNTNLIPALL